MLLLVLVHLLIIDALAPPIDTLRSLSLGREGFTKIQERERERERESKRVKEFGAEQIVNKII